MDSLEYIFPVMGWLVSNLLSLLILRMSLRQPRSARFVLAVVFALAAWINWTTAIKTPENYLNYALYSVLPAYTDFINGWFSRHITVFVGAIAAVQALIAIAFIAGGRFLAFASWGAILFLLAILPLGLGAAFPATILLALAAYVTLQREHRHHAPHGPGHHRTVALH